MKIDLLASNIIKCVGRLLAHNLNNHTVLGNTYTFLDHATLKVSFTFCMLYHVLFSWFKLFTDSTYTSKLLEFQINSYNFHMFKNPVWVKKWNESLHWKLLESQTCFSYFHTIWNMSSTYKILSSTNKY